GGVRKSDSKKGLSLTIVDRSPRQFRRKSSARRSAFAAEPNTRTEIGWPTPSGIWFDRSTACSAPMSGPPQRNTAERTSELVKVTVQLARGFTGAATARSAGSGTGARYGCPALHTHVLPERMTLFIQHPAERGYRPSDPVK